jgi:hypothetical protein
MAVVIDEFEVLAEPAAGSRARGSGDVGVSQAPPDARPAQLQRAIELWAELSRERALRLDDR